ncbi:hypothetical protein Purlil1_13597 [Purpureocillium lilacinum]|uniref:Aminoglycoside phosphotransferase domain-containing protein n=1 Tax=Purpureocillium lilacinum TaxID=33203 RepID=A0ABR0BDL0_PURLI|nr:hypothetical protein Purlil1_13597 [Purpureocillium lilacinum]
MAPVTNQMLNAKREANCVGLTTERKYFKVDHTWIKRSLRPAEWQINPFTGTVVVPRFGTERILNEAAAIQFIAEKTSIPVPKLYACFQDDEAAYLVMEYVDGVTMNELNSDERRIVERELEGHLETLRTLKSDSWGGPSGIIIPPYRVMVKLPRPEWKMKPRSSEDLVFCHNDFSTHNVIVNPSTLKVNAIIDWEYAGFYPVEFEGLFFRRPGPSVALEGEVDDTDELVHVMLENVAQ